MQKAQCPIVVLGMYKPVSTQQFSRGDGLSRWLLFSFALRAPSQGSQADYCGWAVAALGKVIPAPVPIQAAWAFTPNLPAEDGALLGPFSL